MLPCLKGGETASNGGIGQWGFDTNPDHPTDAQSAVTKAIIGVDSRHFALSEINVGYRICDPGDRN